MTFGKTEQRGAGRGGRFPGLGFALALAVAAGAAGAGFARAGDGPESGAVLIERNLGVGDIDPSIYFDVDDTSDPFHEVYVRFRERRARDMASPDMPPPVASFPSVHLSSERPWGDLTTLLPLDWDVLARQSPGAVAGLKGALLARLAFDHADLKIMEMMLGPGGLLPAHAGGSPGIYYCVGGRGEVNVEGEVLELTPGARVKLNPYDVRRVRALGDEPLKLLWIRWAPDGDQRYMKAGYYLTGANQHIQPREAVLPADYQYWGAPAPAAPAHSSLPEVVPGTFQAGQQAALGAARTALGGKRDPYPAVSRYAHEREIPWLSKGMEVNFFWAKDINSLGALLDRWIEVMRYKAFFQATRPDGGWDFNISQMVWGPHARYVEHSHSIPEFYYMVSGPVEHWVGGQKYLAQPGDLFATNSFQAHQSRGVVDNLPFRNVSGSWAPNGDRSVFARPFYLLEALPRQPASSQLSPAEVFLPPVEGVEVSHGD